MARPWAEPLRPRARPNLWSEERSKKTAEWKNATIPEKAEFLGFGNFFEELRDRAIKRGLRD